MSKPLNMESATANTRPARSHWGTVAVIFLVFGAAFPFLAADDRFILLLSSYALIAAIVALSLDLLTGNTGLLSFGHAAWYGLGAYVAGLLSKTVTSDIILLFLMMAAITIILSVLIGAILVRQIGTAFAILTLAFSQIVFAVVFVFSDLTGGEDGLQGIPTPTIFGIDILQPNVWFWILYGSLMVALGLAFHIRRSPLGKSWLAIRENSERAAFVGINVGGLRLQAYVASATLASLAGLLLVLFNGAASPDLLHWFESGKIIMYVVLGGIGTLIGPVLGAIAFTFAEHYISSFSDSWLIYFGGLFIIIIIIAPGGIFGVVSKAWDKSIRYFRRAKQ